MTTRYQKSHYEDVAKLLALHIGPCVPRTVTNCPTTLAAEFVGLFAADNPPNSRCWTCGNTKEAAPIYTRPDGDHRFGGFDREQFLVACGLESEG